MTDIRAMPLALRIKVARVGVGYDQAELGRRVGVSRQTIGHWENGGAQPQLGHAVRLASVTGVSLEWLAAGVEVNEKTPTANSGGLDMCAPPDSNREPIDYRLTCRFDDSIPATAGELIAAWARLDSVPIL
jgi:putative transcriptional regulator